MFHVKHAKAHITFDGVGSAADLVDCKGAAAAASQVPATDAAGRARSVSRETRERDWDLDRLDGAVIKGAWRGCSVGAKGERRLRLFHVKTREAADEVRRRPLGWGWKGAANVGQRTTPPGGRSVSRETRDGDRDLGQLDGAVIERRLAWLRSGEARGSGGLHLLPQCFT